MGYSLLMRFKSLGTDDAIKAHKDIIKKKKYVWAGWWAKPDEALPENQMDLFPKILETEKELCLFIADANEHLIYPCTVTDVVYSPDKLLSPEQDCTPAYYSDRPVYIWFRITQIRDGLADANCLSDYSFADYNLFPTESDTDYSGFNNTAISTTFLVFIQRRSLMLLRDRGADDRDGIQWINTKTNFSSEYGITKSNSILVLSDLHFSENPEAFSFADCQTKKVRVLKSLSETVGFATNREPFASLICAGDFAHHASEKGFQKAEESLISIIFNHSIDKDNVVFVPGNHDMALSEEGSPQEITITKEKAKENYEKFYKKIIGTTPNEFCAIGRKILLKNRLPVEIVGLNSCYLQQEKDHFMGMGYVGSEQLEFVEKEMGWIDERNNERPESHAFRILVLHHHLYPIEWSLEPASDYPYSTCLDAVQIMHFAARNSINLIVHGHKHQFEFVRMTRWTDNKPYLHNILGMGSSSSTDMAISKSNCLAVLDFNDMAQLKIKLLELSTDGIQQQKELFSCDIPLSIGI